MTSDDGYRTELQHRAFLHIIGKVTNGETTVWLVWADDDGQFIGETTTFVRALSMAQGNLLLRVLRAAGLPLSARWRA